MNQIIILPPEPTLADIRKQFERWRATRGKRTRIPEELWEAAVRLSSDYTPHQISKALHLNYLKLKNRILALKKDKSLSAKNDLYSNYKYNAEKRNYKFDLDFDTFLDLTSQNCHYCGIKPKSKWIASKKCKNPSIYIYNGIDRLNNSKGYIKNNCVSACKICNQAKYKLTYKQFTNWINKCFNHLILGDNK